MQSDFSAIEHTLLKGIHEQLSIFSQSVLICNPKASYFNDRFGLTRVFDVCLPRLEEFFSQSQFLFFSHWEEEQKVSVRKKKLACVSYLSGPKANRFHDSRPTETWGALETAETPPERIWYHCDTVYPGLLSNVVVSIYCVENNMLKCFVWLTGSICLFICKYFPQDAMPYNTQL